MRTKFWPLVVVSLFVFAVSAFAAEPMVATWKLDESKSKIPAGMSKSMTVTYTAEGDKYKCVIDGVDGSGQPMHSEWVGKFDGKPYPVTGSQTADARSIEKVSAHKFNVVEMKGGIAVTTGTIAISRDGKSRIVTLHAKSADGTPVTIIQVGDRQ